MKTAEVALEYILAGLLALCAFALPFAKLLGLDLRLGASGALDTGAIVGVLGIAYLLGVVFDRAADTMLSPFENQLRIEKAAELLEDKKGWKKDPFPVSALLYELRSKADGNFEWLQSLRSRIRTTRELAVLGLPAVLGIAVYANCSERCRWPQVWNGGHAAVVLNLVFITACAVACRNQWYKGPKTHELLGPDDEKTVKAMERQSRMARGTFYVLLLYTSVLGIIVGAMDHSSVSVPGFRMSLPMAVFGALLAALAFTSWRRITRTYIGFVAQKLDAPG